MKRTPEVRTEFEAKSEVSFERLLNTEEAAMLLRIHPKTLQRMARKGEIPAMQVGKLRFSSAALLSWQEDKPAG
jgi:excisionase family DNA binding protein